MPKNGPIIIIEDDMDDRHILSDALSDAGVLNELIFFENGPDAFEYLKSSSSQPFLIFCDVNLPRQNGIEFKREMDADPELRAMSIPFIFYMTEIVAAQQGGVLHWTLFTNPLAVAAAMMSFLGSMMRPPFDVVLAPQEIPIGPPTEYHSSFLAMMQSNRA